MINGDLRTVLIFAHECAPYNRVESTVGAQRPAQFAKYLPMFGWRAVVVCCDVSERGKGCSVDLPARVRALLRSADPRASVIVPSPSLPWDGALDRLWRMALPRRGQSSRIKNILRKPITIAKLFTGDYSQPWQPCAREVARTIAEELQVDVVIGEHSPDAGLFLARWYSAKYGVPWVADLRDPILQPMNPVMRRIYKPIARRLVRTAVSTVNVTPFWAELDAELFRRPSASIPNGFDPAEFDQSLTISPSPKFTIAFTGTMWPQMRLEIFLQGLRIMCDSIGSRALSKVRFLYRGTASQRVAELAMRAGVAEVTDAAPHVPRNVALGLLQHSECLLLLSIVPDKSNDVIVSRGVYPAKTFEYFGARRPILCVPGDGGLLDELIARTRTGAILRTRDQVATHLLDLFRRWEDGCNIPYEPRQDEVARYTRRALAGQLANVLDAAVSSGMAA